MGTRGPKPRTAKNRAAKRVVLPIPAGLYATSDLTPVAQEEFQRIVATLDNRGMLERADVGVITEAARIKALLDRAQADVDHPITGLDPDKVRMVTALNAHRLGCLRSLGLTLQPSRSVVKTTMKDPAKAEDPLQAYLKVSG